MMRVISSCEKPRIDGAKRIADLSRYELGFLTRQAFQEGADHGELLVALDENNTGLLNPFRALRQVADYIS